MSVLKQFINRKQSSMAIKPMGLTPQTGVGGIKNPYESSAGFGLQEMQKPPVNLGPRAKPMYEPKPMGGPATKPYELSSQVVPDVPFDQTVAGIGLPVDPKEEYFAQNAARMKPMVPDMYSMRKNREADKFYQRPRNIR